MGLDAPFFLSLSVYNALIRYVFMKKDYSKAIVWLVIFILTYLIWKNLIEYIVSLIR